MMQRRRTKNRISGMKLEPQDNPEQAPRQEEELRKAVADCLQENEMVGG
jgi:hypothetical protein